MSYHKAPEHKPSLVVPWPPAGAKSIVDVTAADTFASLAAANSVTASAIQYFNFNTVAVKEMNWYLYHKVGCRLKTVDGESYQFSDAHSDPPPNGFTPKSLKIAIPPDGWTRPDDVDAHKVVAAALAEANNMGIRFKLPYASLESHDLLHVRSVINSGKIRVEYEPAMGRWAQYHPGTNRLRVGFKENLTLNDKSLVVHESIHAAMDKRSVGLDKWQSESIAYIGQCMYFYKKGAQPLYGESAAAGAGKILDEGMKFVNDVLISKVTVTAELLKPLEDAIKAVQTYVDQENPVNNGI